MFAQRELGFERKLLHWNIVNFSAPKENSKNGACPKTPSRIFQQTRKTLPVENIEIQTLRQLKKLQMTVMGSLSGFGGVL